MASDFGNFLENDGTELVIAPPNRLFDADAQGRPRVPRFYSLAAGQLRR